jgi:uncharacterized protein (DUF302 family)
MVDGLITIPSKLRPEETVTRLEAELQARSITLFARIDHAAGATAVGLALRPTVLLIFGNAKTGTPLMQEAQTVGIDLPLKLLVWQDEKGATQISYNRPAWVSRRHGIETAKISDAMEAMLNNIIKSL